MNDPHVISRNNKVIAINSAIEVDITGQVCADSIGTMHVVTKYGIAYVYGENLRQRAKALIDIAHPDDREILNKQCFDRFRIFGQNSSVIR